MNKSNSSEKLPKMFDLIDDEMILTPRNIANFVGVHEETVRRWCRSKYLRVISPFGRYKIRGEDFKDFAYKWYQNKTPPDKL